MSNGGLDAVSLERKTEGAKSCDTVPLRGWSPCSSVKAHQKYLQHDCIANEKMQIVIEIKLELYTVQYTKIFSLQILREI